MTKNLLTTQEISRELNIHRTTLYRWRSQWIEGIHWLKIPKGRRVYYDAEAIAKWIQQPHAQHIKWCQRRLKQISA